MAMKKDNEISLRDAIKGFIKSYHLDGKVNEQRIREIWSEVMGKTISQYTTSIYLRQGTLTIVLNSAPLKQDLMFQKDLIRKRLNDELGEAAVKEVVIR
jgi:hypothetical protein